VGCVILGVARRARAHPFFARCSSRFSRRIPILALIGATCGAVAGAACLIPAVRAIRIEPASALCGNSASLDERPHDVSQLRLARSHIRPSSLTPRHPSRMHRAPAAGIEGVGQGCALDEPRRGSLPGPVPPRTRPRHLDEARGRILMPSSDVRASITFRPVRLLPPLRIHQQLGPLRDIGCADVLHRTTLRASSHVARAKICRSP
jgi:hypothetical protein